MADLFLNDLGKQTALLESLDGPLADRRREERHGSRHWPICGSRMTSYRNPHNAAG
jgi:hypothetical protein